MDPREPDTFAHDSLVMRIAVSLAVTGTLTPLVVVFCLTPWLFWGPLFSAVIMWLIIGAPVMVFTLVIALLATLLVEAVRSSLCLRLSPTTLGGVIGAVTTVPFATVWWMAPFPSWYLVPPILLGFAFQIGGAVGATRFEQDFPTRAARPFKLQFGIRQIMVATAWVTILLAVLLNLRPPNQMLISCGVWAVAQLLLLHFALPGVTGWFYRGLTRIGFF